MVNVWKKKRSEFGIDSKLRKNVLGRGRGERWVLLIHARGRELVAVNLFFFFFATITCDFDHAEY